MPVPMTVTADSTTHRVAEVVYEKLRGAIVRGELRPNERLIETDLAEWLNVSRTPIRESLHRLAADRLVENRRRGWVVRDPTSAEIREIYELRAALEGYAARLAAERASDEDLARISAQAKRDAAIVNKKGNREHFVETNENFHNGIVDLCGNGRLANAVNMHRQFYYNQRLAATYTRADQVAAAQGHLAIVAAVAARNGDLAERLTRKHVADALEVALARLS